MLRISTAGLSALFAMLSLGTVAFAKDPASPREAFDAYINNIRSLDTATAAIDMWDFKAFLVAGFGDAFTKLSPADQDAAVASMRKMITTAYASPKIIEVMAKVEVIGVIGFNMPDDTSVICFGAANPDGKKTAMQMKFKKIEGQWRVVDMGSGGGMLSAQLRILYAPSAAKISVEQFARDMANGSDRMSGPAH